MTIFHRLLRRRRSVLSGRLALCVLLSAAVAPGPGSASDIRIRSHGGYYVGGQPVRAAESAQIATTADFVRGATYVEYTRLARPRSRWPIVMFPGGGFSAASFQDTPDGRPGWEWSFLRRGYDVFLVDAARTGRSPIRRFPDIDPEPPKIRSSRFLWEVFRIGRPGSYAGRAAFPDTRFPIAHFDELSKQAAPRFNLPRAQEAAQYDAVIRRACPCILLLHSAAGGPGMAAAQRWPSLVKAVIAVEPAEVPDETSRLSSRAAHIFVWGDHLTPADTDPDWYDEYQHSKRFRERLERAGVATRMIDLPALGIHGNSHFPMLDNNSDEIADLIDRELRRALRP